MDLLKEGTAKPLHHSAEHLAVKRGRIDDFSDVFDSQIIHDLHVSRSRIDGNVNGMRTVTVGVFGIREASLGGNAQGSQFREREHQVPVSSRSLAPLHLCRITANSRT